METSQRNFEITAERQRQRANKWAERAQEVEKLEKQKAEYIDTVESLAQDFLDLKESTSKDIEQLRAGIEGWKDAAKRKHDEINALRKEKVKLEQGFAVLVNKLNSCVKAIGIGKREIARREKVKDARLKARRDKKTKELHEEIIEFLDSPLSNHPDWLDRAIKRYLEADSVVKINVKHGGPVKPVWSGSRGYFTTPSGKTIVNYPSAYGWPTIYHCDSRKITVGYSWLRKQAHRIAKLEAEKQVR